MTTGIYKLNFKNTDKCYIGQSTSSIEKRFVNHLRAMRNGFASTKLLNAYSEYGEPTLEVLVEATDSEDLDALEKEAIQVYNSIANGFNTLTGGSTGNGQYGETASNAKYSNNTYCSVLKMLASGVSIKETAKELEVSQPVVSSIHSCENHKWLKEVLPNEYAIVESEHLEYSPKNNHAQARGITYEPLVCIKTGVQYNVVSLRETARQLNLESGNLSRLLNGAVDSYKGYMLLSKLSKSNSKFVIDPTGVTHEIPYRGLSSFAAKHGLAKSMLSNLLNKKRSEYNGWTVPDEPKSHT